MFKQMVVRSTKIFSTAVIVCLLSSACSRNEDPTLANSPPPVPVKLQTLQSSMLEDSSEFVGTLEAKQVVTLRPQIDGRVSRISASDGQQVKAGMPIIQLEPDREIAQVNAALAGVDRAKAVRDNARANVAQAEAEVNSAIADLAQAKANVKSRKAELEQKQADLKLAEKELQRAQFLVSQGAQAKQQLDIRSSNRDVALSATNAARENLSAANASQAAAEAKVQVARDKLRAVQASLEEQNASIAQSQAELDSTSTDLKYNRVVAPIEGTVGDILVKIGDYVKTGDPLTTITQDRAFDLNISIPVERADDLRLGLPVELVGNDLERPTALGSISFISPQVDTNAQAILAKVTFSNNGNLRNGQFVKARVIWSQRAGVLIPTTAVSRLGGANFVFVAEQDPSQDRQIVRQRAVELGAIQGQNYQVKGGIKAGESIAVSGILKLRDGAQIQPGS